MSWPERNRDAIKILLHIALANVALAGAYLFCRNSLPESSALLGGPYLAFVLCRLIGLWMAGVPQVSWRYFAVPDAVRILIGGLCGSLLLAVFGISGEIYGSRPEAALDGALLILLEWSAHLGFRVAFLACVRANSKGRRALIIGMGSPAVSLMREMLESGSMIPVGFVTPEGTKKQGSLSGFPVLGSMEDVEQIVERRRVDDLVVALPTQDNREVRELIRRFEHLPVRLLFLPSLPERLTDRDSLRRLRSVRSEDLLERPAALLQNELATAMVSGSRVLITGAGGSIGSVLARQIAAMKPETLILVGRGEGSLFELELALKSDPDVDPSRHVFIVADIRDRQRLEAIFRKHRPQLVFHAAAHKHVPLMERNPEEAVKNNVLGTQNVAEMAARFDAERFVLISTDKAVRPTSVMGASKRISEMVVQDIASRSSGCFMTVRFGNVLGSRGSLLPILEKQVIGGGPITITHPDMTRFFMTIPEAVHLVLQAAALGTSGDLFILDMGEPVKVMELAKEYIRLCGLVPERDISIRIVGPRPGEKLHEELLTGDEEVIGRVADRIVRARLPEISHNNLRESLEVLEAAANRGDQETIRSTFAHLIPAYGNEAEAPGAGGLAAGGVNGHGAKGGNGTHGSNGVHTRNGSAAHGANGHGLNGRASNGHGLTGLAVNGHAEADDPLAPSPTHA